LDFAFFEDEHEDDDEDDLEWSHVARKKTRAKVDGLSPLPVSSLVRNHWQDLIWEGGMDNG
jgi:hypothetical protein